MKKLSILILLIVGLITTSSAQAPPFKSIDSLRIIDANGLPNRGDTLTRVSTIGIVYGPNTNKYRTSGGLTFILNNHTAGTKVYSTRSFGYTFHEGDSIMIYGTIKNFGGEAEFQTKAGDTIIVLGQGHLDAPIVVTNMDESTEAKLIELDNIDMSTVATGGVCGWGPFGKSYFTACYLVNNSATNHGIYIDSFESVALFFWPKPTGLYNIVGFGSQHVNTAPFTTVGYQIVPRDTTDFHKVTVGIHDVKNNLNAVVFPNPASSMLNVAFEYGKEESATIRITDMTGRVMMTEVKTITSGDNMISLNTANYATGMYVIEVYTAEKSLVAKFNKAN